MRGCKGIGELLVMEARISESSPFEHGHEAAGINPGARGSHVRSLTCSSEHPESNLASC